MINKMDMMVMMQFVYLKSSFAPHPQEEVGVLADTFGVVDEGKSVRLVLHYALSPAWAE